MLLLPIADDNPTRRPPVVTRALLGISVALWLFGTATGLQRGIFYTLGLVPADFHFLNLVTSQFIHSGIFHLAGNMLFFWIFADNVEDRLGRPWFLFMYLTSGAVGALAHCLFVSGTDAQLPLGGASGAISGVMGAYLVFYPRQPIRIFYLIFIFPGVFHARALWVVGLYGLQQVLAILLTGGTGSGVAYWAHLGGFAAGLAFAGFDRLRGGLPHDVSGNPAEIPWALKISPDVPVEHPGGGWAVLRADDALADESGSAGVVARVTGEARRGITRRLRRTRGVVAHG
ncbi:MAG: rhomboid family intramembrane serine protease, partial [Candidatus Brocadiae bacterium]|nr:rhomboid family intramembrane serine protease [Candidatus Brocadiia bacterium]